jgi:hypothetical protein
MKYIRARIAYFNSRISVFRSRNFAVRRIALELDFVLGYSTHIEMQNEAQIDQINSEIK